VIDPLIAAVAVPTTVGFGVLLTGLFLGIRHGIDWDHIAAITDITSTTASARMAEAAHVEQHHAITGHSHGHGGAPEVRAHDAGPGAATLAPAMSGGPAAARRTDRRSGGRDPPRDLYALGHGVGWSSLGSRRSASEPCSPTGLIP
jgi:hypothetical protein